MRVSIAYLSEFAFQQIMEEVTTNQQLSHFYKFRSQVASVCERVKVSPGEMQASSKEYVVLYPFYDIRFYNPTPQKAHAKTQTDAHAW